MTRVLLLAGTTEAAELARRLHAAEGVVVVASFAGRVEELGAVPCAMRIGGFGGVGGLVEELAGYDLLVDATHPFAAQMSRHAWRAAQEVGVPFLRLEREPWRPEEGDQWHEVADLDEAARWLASHGIACALLATGRHELAPFAGLTSIRLIVRTIDEPERALPANVEVVVARGPFTERDELQLLQSRHVEAVVTRNSGGAATVAKLHAARSLHLPVVMVRRPPPEPTEKVATVEDALAWVLARR